MFSAFVLLWVLCGLESIFNCRVHGIQIRQTFYDDGPSSDDYAGAASNSAGDQGYGGSSSYDDDTQDYEAGAHGYHDNKKRKNYASAAEDEDAYPSRKTESTGYEPRSYQDNYEPVYQRKPKQPSKGHGYNDDDDDDDYNRRRSQKKKQKKKKIKPKVIIVKKIIPLSTTTAVG